MRDLFSPLPNINRRIEQEEHPWRERFGSQRINRREVALPQTISPMLDLTVMTALPTSLMVINDQATPWCCQRA